MINKRKGISLIVLVITIIVIIIIAAAIILSLKKANIIENANTAVEASDLKNAETAVMLYISNRWVEDTNGDGTPNDEIGAMYSGTITNSPSDLYITLNGTITTIQITLTDLDLGMLDEVVIKDNKVVSIKKGNNTYNNSGNIGNITDAITISKEQYNSIINGINDLKTKVQDLQNDNTQKNTAITNVQNKVDSNDLKISTANTKIDSIITDLDVSQKAVLFEGTADKTGTYPIVNISEYKYLVVYADMLYGGTTRQCALTQIISIDDIKYGTANQYVSGFPYTSTLAFWLGYSFTKENNNSYKLSIDSVTSYGDYKSPRIYKIEGIK